MVIPGIMKGNGANSRSFPQPVVQGDGLQQAVTEQKR
jgi:hypothetical protein